MSYLQTLLDTAGKVLTAKFGGVTNHTEFESDGTMVFNGDSAVWEDVVGSLVANKLESVAGALQYNYVNNSITMNTGGVITNVADRLIFNFLYPHSAIPDGLMKLHIHWEQADATDREFTVEYRVQVNGAAKTTAWTQVVVGTNANNVFTYTSGTLMQITNLVSVDMTGAGLAPTVQFRLARTDAVAGDIEAVFADAHVARDMAGSRGEYVK